MRPRWGQAWVQQRQRRSQELSSRKSKETRSQQKQEEENSLSPVRASTQADSMELADEPPHRNVCRTKEQYNTDSGLMRQVQSLNLTGCQDTVEEDSPSGREVKQAQASFGAISRTSLAQAEFHPTTAGDCSENFDQHPLQDDTSADDDGMMIPKMETLDQGRVKPGSFVNRALCEI